MRVEDDDRAIDALTRYIQRESWQIRDIHEGIREADAGEFATDEQVKAAFAKWMDGDDPCLGPKPRRRIETAWRTGTVAVSAIIS